MYGLLLVTTCNKKEFEQEVYGVLRTQTGSYLPAKLVMAITGPGRHREAGRPAL